MTIGRGNSRASLGGAKERSSRDGTTIKFDRAGHCASLIQRQAVTSIADFHRARPAWSSQLFHRWRNRDRRGHLTTASFVGLQHFGQVPLTMSFLAFFCVRLLNSLFVPATKAASGHSSSGCAKKQPDHPTARVGNCVDYNDALPA
jgi:hypothetical protein